MSTPTRYSFERCEKKYFVTPAQQQALLRGIEAHMEPDVYGNYSICNLYYDTPDYRLIRASIEKPAYKEKLRVRSYGVPQEQSRIFVELKKKYSGTVYKRRVSMEACMTAPFLAGLAPKRRPGRSRRRSSGSSVFISLSRGFFWPMTAWPSPGRKTRSFV